MNKALTKDFLQNQSSNIVHFYQKTGHNFSSLANLYGCYSGFSKYFT